MKKKIIALLFAATMLTAIFAGCGSSSDSSTSSDESSASVSDSGESASADLGYNITLIMSLRDEFLSTLESAALAAAEELGINLTTQDANNDSSMTIQYIEACVTAGEDAIIINMVDPETAAQCVEAAGDVPVVFVNRFPSDESVLTENVVYVGSDEMASGRYQGEFLVEYFTELGQTEISYILLNGTLGQTSTTNRTESVLQALEDGGITATEASAPLAADYDRATAMDMIAPLLTTTEYDCIISNNDAMALGAIEAMNQAGLDPSSIPIVGIDATADGLQALQEGTLAMTVFQNAEGQGMGSLLAAVNLIEGNDIAQDTGFEVDDENEYIIWVPFEPVTIDNVEDYL